MTKSDHRTSVGWSDTGWTGKAGHGKIRSADTDWLLWLEKKMLTPCRIIISSVCHATLEVFQVLRWNLTLLPLCVCVCFFLKFTPHFFVWSTREILLKTAFALMQSFYGSRSRPWTSEIEEFIFEIEKKMHLSIACIFVICFFVFLCSCMWSYFAPLFMTFPFSSCKGCRHSWSERPVTSLCTPPECVKQREDWWNCVSLT